MSYVSGISDLVDFLEAKYSRENLQQMAKNKGLSEAGTKRDLAAQIINKRLEDVPRDERYSTLESLRHKGIVAIISWIAPWVVPTVGESGVNWNLQKTDLPYYDNLIKDPEYFARAKGVQGNIEYMSPGEYMHRCSQIFNVPERLVSQATSTKQIYVYVDQMKRGDRFPIPVLDMAIGTQEGRHRVLAAQLLGAKTIPVLVVKEV